MSIKVDEIPNPTPAQLAALPREVGFVPAVNAHPQTLSPAQIDGYNDLGFLMPLDGLQVDEVRELRAFFDGVLAAFIELGRTSYSINTAHLRFARIYQLVQHPRIVAAVADLLGPNIVCWGSHFFCKMPHDGKRVPWHQDSTYWPLSPTKTVTVWLAIDDADPENANMKFIPRSHQHGLIDYDESQDANTVLNLAVENAESYGDREVDVTLRSGQFSMHSDLLLHGSEANCSDRRRCGLTIRYAAADVTTWYDWHQKGILVRGENTSGQWANPAMPDH
ncbi:phytanoyl-CoA dioxygenase family protein [Allorhodopirellula heiligendammensis]|uniref:Phytanoyl-CoA dioxygenase (PhyH) n=1 Tax=Allorhodopirellula heiligendammensis TaxID=2714739 RepID=A0A5C6BTW7_9BACT|nr:phytanoyl-CoA dioxygenase family protein [Allorhodopirellula heiligendammensis]TWU15673.1 Phytanoyl-CoA dioxygenase (PhyH) [Allorhodopirellula heiligendammensis]